MERGSGLLVHISSLPGKYGIGTFGNEAMAFVDTLSVKGHASVPADENGIEALINEDISGY